MAGPALGASSPSEGTQRQSPSRRQPPQPWAGLCSSREAKAATAGVSPASGICVEPSCSARALLLCLARLVTYSQTSLRLDVGTLHLPPAYDPVPVLDYSRESRFFPTSVFQSTWRSGSTRTRVEQPPITTWLQPRWAAGSGKLECGPRGWAMLISMWDSGVTGLRGKPVLPARRDSAGQGCSSLGLPASGLSPVMGAPRRPPTELSHRSPASRG